MTAPSKGKFDMDYECFCRCHTDDGGPREQSGCVHLIQCCSQCSKCGKRTQAGWEYYHHCHESILTECTGN